MRLKNRGGATRRDATRHRAGTVALPFSFVHVFLCISYVCECLSPILRSLPFLSEQQKLSMVCIPSFHRLSLYFLFPRRIDSGAARFLRKDKKKPPLRPTLYQPSRGYELAVVGCLLVLDHGLRFFYVYPRRNDGGGGGGERGLDR